MLGEGFMMSETRPDTLPSGHALFHHVPEPRERPDPDRARGGLRGNGDLLAAEGQHHRARLPRWLARDFDLQKARSVNVPTARLLT